jgi:acetolactate synthase regulatory subunit
MKIVLLFTRVNQIEHLSQDLSRAMKMLRVVTKRVFMAVIVNMDSWEMEKNVNVCITDVSNPRQIIYSPSIDKDVILVNNACQDLALILLSVTS